MAYQIVTEETEKGNIGVLKITRECGKMAFKFYPTEGIAHAKRICNAIWDINKDTNITYLIVKVTESD